MIEPSSSRRSSTCTGWSLWPDGEYGDPVTRIRLIGRPRLERDGTVLPPPRGYKTWAVLARLVRSPQPVSRRTLVDELFSEADDPLGALRWSLAELRRQQSLDIVVGGDPVSLSVGPATSIDVADVAAGEVGDDIPRGQFLEGLDGIGSSAFESWLLVERHRVDSEVLSALRQATLRALSARDFDRAIVAAEAMIHRAALEEGAHVLLVKALAASGDAGAARRQAEASEAMFEAELGISASPAIRAAARPSLTAPIPGVSRRASTVSLLDAGLAAVSAGAADAGIECLRGAAASAESSGDPALLGRCLLELGTALVHAVRGFDDEGAVILGMAATIALDAGAELTAARALSELAYVDLLASRRSSAMHHLAEAGRLADDDPALVAAIAGFDAMNLSDWGRLDASMERFPEAVELSRRAGARRRESWTLGIGARTLFSQGRLSEAMTWAKLSCELADQERWTAFRPWPESWLAHVRLAMGEAPSDVRDDAEATFALARQLHDPCWEGLAAKTIGLTYLAEGDAGAGQEWMTNAITLCRRESDGYRWLEVEVLVTQARAAFESGEIALADTLTRRAIAGAAKGSMEGLLDRALELRKQIVSPG